MAAVNIASELNGKMVAAKKQARKSPKYPRDNQSMHKSS